MMWHYPCTVFFLWHKGGQQNEKPPDNGAVGHLPMASNWKPKK